jgi:hypothetical protein
MKSFVMEVSKKELVAGSNQYVKQGDVTIYYPLLSELGIAIDPEKMDENGFPVYTDEKVQYVFDAMLAAVKAQARNKLVSGTAKLKDGQSIADTVEALLESGGGNKGDALAAVREFLASFKAWLPTTGKKEAVQAAVYDLAANRKGLALQTMEKKQKFLGYLSDFAETLTEEQAARFSRPLLALNECCEAGDALDDM